MTQADHLAWPPCLVETQAFNPFRAMRIFARTIGKEKLPAGVAELTEAGSSVAL